jgi:hypothetical protein
VKTSFWCIYADKVMHIPVEVSTALVDAAAVSTCSGISS